MIDEIPDETRRRAVRLFYLEEASLPEVSAATGVKVSTLTTWLSRFRAAARKALGAGDGPATKRRPP
jgi:DNA-directed RNA polymerase specialized sigma24 family protein